MVKYTHSLSSSMKTIISICQTWQSMCLEQILCLRSESNSATVEMTMSCDWKCTTWHVSRDHWLVSRGTYWITADIWNLIYFVAYSTKKKTCVNRTLFLVMIECYPRLRDWVQRLILNTHFLIVSTTPTHFVVIFIVHLGVLCQILGTFHHIMKITQWTLQHCKVVTLKH